MTTVEPAPAPAQDATEPVSSVAHYRGSVVMMFTVSEAPDQQGSGDFMFRPEELQVHWARVNPCAMWQITTVTIRGPRINPGAADHKTGSATWFTLSAMLPGWAQKIISNNWPEA